MVCALDALVAQLAPSPPSAIPTDYCRGEKIAASVDFVYTL
jgi:hypothetical protein